jgi:prepilin-type processing-associated H-X9-DG protein
MSTSVTCFCGKTFPAPDALAGGYTRCPECGAVVYVPWPLPATQERARTPGPHPLRTLVKVLCVIAVLAFLVALFTPVTAHSDEAVRRMHCVNNLKQIALAMQNYESAHNAFPPQAVTDPNGKPLLSWRVLLLPYLGEGALYARFKLDEPWDSPSNRPLLALMPMVYCCPSDVPYQPGMTSYEGVVGSHTMFRDDRRGVCIADVIDGTSNTIFFGEACSPVPWSAPVDIPFDTSQPHHGFGSQHPGGFNAAFVDGSVRFIKRTINPPILDSMLTRDGGEVWCDESL